MKNLFRSVMYAKKRGQSLVEISIVLFLLLVVVVGVITHYNQQHAGKVADVAVQMSNDRSREQGTAVSVSGADTAANNTDPEATSTPNGGPDVPVHLPSPPVGGNQQLGQQGGAQGNHPQPGQGQQGGNTGNGGHDGSLQDLPDEHWFRDTVEEVYIIKSEEVPDKMIRIFEINNHPDYPEGVQIHRATYFDEEIQTFVDAISIPDNSGVRTCQVAFFVVGIEALKLYANPMEDCRHFVGNMIWEEMVENNKILLDESGGWVHMHLLDEQFYHLQTYYSNNPAP